MLGQSPQFARLQVSAAARPTTKRARMQLQNLQTWCAKLNSRISLSASLRKIQAKKKPTRHRGELAALFLAKNAHPLRHRRVAWLTAFQPITVAGPRPNFTAFPAAHACKLKFECMTRVERCQRERVFRQWLSDFSTAACAFPPARATLPANLPGGTVR